MCGKYLFGIVHESPNNVYSKSDFIVSTKYHLPNDIEPQWYLFGR